MPKYLLTKDLDCVMGHLRYGHLEVEIEADNLEDAKKKAQEYEEQPSYMQVVIDDYSIDDWEAGSEPIQIEEIKE